MIGLVVVFNLDLLLSFLRRLRLDSPFSADLHFFDLVGLIEKIFRAAVVALYALLECRRRPTHCNLHYTVMINVDKLRISYYSIQLICEVRRDFSDEDVHNVVDAAIAHSFEIPLLERTVEGFEVHIGRNIRAQSTKARP